MRRYILLSLLLCLKWTAWGQATYDYRYWFDADDKTQRTGTAAADNWHIDADVSDLTYTYHSIHLQVKDTAGVWSAPVTRHFIKQPDPKAMKGYYWLNDNVKERTEIPVSADEFQIDVSDLDNKMHYIHYLSYDDDWNVSVPQTSYFLKSIVEREDATFYYWTDNNSNDVKSGKCTGEVMMLDMSGEEDGFHVLHLVGGMDGEFSQPMTRMFIKVPQTEGVGSLTCLCYVDGKIYKQESVPSTGGIVDWNLNVGLLSNGFHSIQVQVVTPTGAATSVHESFFFRTTMAGELGQMKLVYNVDGGEYKSQAGDFGTGAFHFDIDVAELKDGLHRLNYMLMSETGTSTKMNSSFFVKTPLGGPGVASYKYWINDNEEEAVKVTLEKRQELFKLISLLPVKAQPIRSSCFHFEVEEDGTPMMYAKNDFHIQFIDVKNYNLDAARQYIDYNVGQAVEEFTELESGKRVYKAKPGDNEVIWFKVEAERGDSLALKTDQACTLQIFSPTGKEVYSASGSTSVKYDGCHAQENGIHYIALHDVTGTNGANIALDFMHIDRYAILRWDVSLVGNGGASTITYEGNGFQNLYAIDYVNSCDDTLKCEHIEYINDATIAATMDFDGAAIGTYDAIFRFTEEDKVIENAVNVEEARDITIKSRLTYPNAYLRNTTVTYTLNLTNNGNMTAYRVPLYVYIASPTEEGIKKINIEGLKLPKFLDGLDRDSLSAEWLEYEESIGEGHYFLTLKGYDEDFKDSATIRSAYFFTDLRPNDTHTISLILQADEKVNVWFTVPDSVNAITTKEIYGVESRMLSSRSSISRSYCCYHEQLACIGGVVGDIVGFASNIADLTGIAPAQALKIADCAIGTINTIITATGEVACNENNVSLNFYEKLKKVKDGISISGTIVGCFKKFIEKSKLLLIGDISSFLGTATHVTTWADCSAAFSKKKPNCPPKPPIGGISDAVNSFDPNDIYGYRAASGSKAIIKGQRELYYTIEFENDTAFATASAQNVYLTDTLDAHYFDLKSFAPTSLKIGDKTVTLDGEKDFIVTVDMRPSINAIAQVECDYDSKTGIAKWHLSSLDPMTMEPVTHPMDGFLPVNNSNGDGIGQVSFNINLRDDFDDGTEISNRASIVFDYNETIITPTWINVIDTIAPVGEILDFSMPNDSTITLHLGGSDNYSGVWKYDIYAQLGENTIWFEVAEDVTDSLFNYVIYDDFDYGFCVVATDSAGNIETKKLERQCTASVFKLGDANSDGAVDAADVVLTISKYLGNDVLINAMAADVNRDGVIDAQDIVGIQQIFLESETQARTNGIKIRQRLWQKQ